MNSSIVYVPYPIFILIISANDSTSLPSSKPSSPPSSRSPSPTRSQPEGKDDSGLDQHDKEDNHASEEASKEEESGSKEEAIEEPPADASQTIDDNAAEPLTTDEKSQPEQPEEPKDQVPESKDNDPDSKDPVDEHKSAAPNESTQELPAAPSQDQSTAELRLEEKHEKPQEPTNRGEQNKNSDNAPEAQGEDQKVTKGDARKKNDRATKERSKNSTKSSSAVKIREPEEFVAESSSASPSSSIRQRDPPGSDIKIPASAGKNGLFGSSTIRKDEKGRLQEVRHKAKKTSSVEGRDVKPAKKK